MSWTRSGIFILFVFASVCVSGQSVIILNQSFNSTSFESFAGKVESNFEVSFLYDDDLSKLGIPEIGDSISLKLYLNKFCNEIGASFIINEYQQVILRKGDGLIKSIPVSIYQTIKEEIEVVEVQEDQYMKTLSDITSERLVVGSYKGNSTQGKATFKGTIRASKTGEAIIGATIIDKDSKRGTSTDVDGNFEIEFKKGLYTILVNSINYAEKKIQIDLRSSEATTILLDTEDQLLDEVVITSQKYNQVQNTQMGVERLTLKTIKEIPLVMGESDILKVMTMLPGVQSVGEGVAGFNVRGSPADQNLFYIDNIPLYSTSHLFGFFSAFNSDAISEFTLMKSNMPARYGGRLSSITEISAKEGDMESFKFNGGISPVSGRLILEAPLIKNKLSLIVSGRTTYSNYILNRISNPDFNQSEVFFGDTSAKLSYKLNDRNKFNFFGYYSLDDINFGGDSRFDNKNKGASFNWQHSYTDGHKFNFSGVYSEYSLSVDNVESPSNSFAQYSGIGHGEVKYAGRIFVADKHYLNYGASSTLYNVDLGYINPIDDESRIDAQDFGQEKGLESAIFASTELNFIDALSLTAGVRYNNYHYLGPNDILQYAEGVDKTENSVIDTLTFGNNESIVSHSNLDYRISAKYELSPSLSLKGSFNTLHQYIFLLSNTIALAPNDKWKLTDTNIDPMSGQQLSLGIYSKIMNDRFDVSVEGYSKRINNLVEFKDGADLISTQYPEQDVLPGKLNSYGVEFLLKKPNGKFNGWFNYTFSNAEVTVDNPYEGGQTNFGETYKANYDKPHAFNFVINYKMRKRVSISANVVYSTGRPITYPTAIYSQNEISLVNYSARNANRVDDYFRTDISVKFEGNLKKKKVMHSNWVFSVYNLTGRKNAYNVFFQSSANSIVGYKVSIFAQPIFSITYNFKFGNYNN